MNYQEKLEFYLTDKYILSTNIKMYDICKIIDPIDQQQAPNELYTFSIISNKDLKKLLEYKSGLHENNGYISFQINLDASKDEDDSDIISNIGTKWGHSSDGWLYVYSFIISDYSDYMVDYAKHHGIPIKTWDRYGALIPQQSASSRFPRYP